MPDLPSMTLNQNHYDRVVAAFPGATAAEKVAAYRAWLQNRLIERVHTVEAQRIDLAAAIERQVELDQLAASLPPKVAERGMP